MLCDVIYFVHFFHPLLLIYRFNKLTDRFFKNSPWPNADVVAPIVDDGKFL